MGNNDNPRLGGHGGLGGQVGGQRAPSKTNCFLPKRLVHGKKAGLKKGRERWKLKRGGRTGKRTIQPAENRVEERK